MSYNINNISHLGAGTSTEKFLKMQEKANNAYFTNKYNTQIETIDLDVEDFGKLLNDSKLAENVSTNKYGTQNGDFVTLKTDYWTDNPLKFTKDEQTGSYLIEQKDENGNWVAMGWTTEDVAQDYMYKMSEMLNKENTNVNQNSDYLSTVHRDSVATYENSDSLNPGSNNSNSQVTTDNTEGQNNQTTTVFDVSSFSIEEKKSYVAYHSSKGTNRETEMYNKLSGEAKKMVDAELRGDEVVQIGIEGADIKVSVDHRADIIIPKEKDLYINGKNVNMSGTTFRYDPVAGNYRKVIYKGEFNEQLVPNALGNDRFSLEEIYNAVIN